MRLCSSLVTCVAVFTTCAGLVQADDTDDLDFDFDTDALVNSIKGAMDTLFDYVGDKDGCFYKCPNGKF